MIRCVRLMHLVYCVIDVKGGLKGWTVLRIGGSERKERVVGKATKGQKEKLQTRNKSIKHRSLGIEIESCFRAEMAHV